MQPATTVDRRREARSQLIQLLAARLVREWREEQDKSTTTPCEQPSTPDTAAIGNAKPA